MARPRKITIEYLNEKHKSAGVTFIKQLDDPNKALITINRCNHNKEVFFHGLKSKVLCEECLETEMKNLCSTQNLLYLTKLNYGTSKSSSEYRLCCCKVCGNFILFIPSSIRKGTLQCRICQRNKQEVRLKELGYTLLNRIEDGKIVVTCDMCRTDEILQSSNVMRWGSYCKTCNAKVNKSYCYMFKLIIAGQVFIKIGKSNIPYLRSLNFADSSNLKIEFITQKLFSSEKEALMFERFLKFKFKQYNIPKEITKEFMISGFTEVYSIDSLAYFMKEFDENN